MGEFITAYKTTDLPDGKMIGVEVKGENILVANVQGKYYAIGDICTHEGCRLSDGMLKDDVVECPCHDSQFDVTSGAVISPPAEKPVRSFKVKVEGTDIMIEM